MSTRTTDEKIPATLRINADLLNRLKVLARYNNRSLNDYVEALLYDIVFKKTGSRTAHIITGFDAVDDYGFRPAGDKGLLN